MTRLALFFLLGCVACGGKVDERSSPDQAQAAGTETKVTQPSNDTRREPPPSGAGQSSSASEPACWETAAPKCADGDTAFARKEDACRKIEGTACYERSNCAGTNHCRHYDETICKGMHECPDGSSEVPGCTDDPPCTTQTICGHTISCQTNE